MPASKGPKIQKECAHCGKEFWSNNKRRIYCSATCNTKHNRKINPIQQEKARKRSREHYRRLSPEKRKDSKLKNRYGISLEIFNEMIKAQNGKCIICETETKLIVDHSHKTGIVRDLLCNSCNGVVGYCKENIKILQNTIKYIEKWECI